MPNREFLEKYPLYRKFRVSGLPSTTDNLPVVTINLGCPKCKSDQTFVMTNKYWENEKYANYPCRGMVLRLVYLCAHCQEFQRYFFVKVDDKSEYLMKVGQYPAWDISSEPRIEELLGTHADIFKRGLICESQGYGIAAFAYYRRIVEEIIGQLLEQISDLMSGEEKDRFLYALKQTKKTTITQDKIALVKDLLPDILRPGGMNPLSALHSVLSEGLHEESDETCLEYAMAVREAVVYLVNQVASTQAASKSFTTSMRKLLEKKTGGTS